MVKRILHSTYFKVSLFVISFAMVFISCDNKNDDVGDEELVEEFEDVEESEEAEDKTYKLPQIDLSHWKVTLPIGNPTEVKPPEILSYATNETLKPFFYNDSINGALVFYAYPHSTTANTSYSRTELRELMKPDEGENANWTFGEGGYMKGTLAMDEISKDSKGKYHRSIIMQIHGRLTNAQRDLIGQKDNNAPPMLKIYWVDGKVRVKTKILKDLNASDVDVLKTDSWGDDVGYTFSEYVGFEKFTLEVKVANGKMEVILNGKHSRVYDDIHIQKWHVFENYFKAGNYLSSIDSGAFAKVKYYDLVVKH
ncbi:polysaccharide lyase family 7 protein [Mariniflexile ostreae]|uniref:Polysaccharide lyase family 7 protein n=1 Tax=Mariniflexile ostreae TaxID=1520892 RepID=A0ABV5FER5_9FLAO